MINNENGMPPKICHKLPPVIMQKQSIGGGVETEVRPITCFGAACSYYCNIEDACIDACSHNIEHINLHLDSEGGDSNGEGAQYEEGA